MGVDGFRKFYWKVGIMSGCQYFIFRVKSHAQCPPGKQSPNFRLGLRTRRVLEEINNIVIKNWVTETSIILVP